MNFCPKCGMQVKKGLDECPDCGTIIKEVLMVKENKVPKVKKSKIFIYLSYVFFFIIVGIVLTTGISAALRNVDNTVYGYNPAYFGALFMVFYLISFMCLLSHKRVSVLVFQLLSFIIYITLSIYIKGKPFIIHFAFYFVLVLVITSIAFTIVRMANKKHFE